MDGRRTIRWEGFHNARDLGGLPVAGGGVTRYGGLIRSADLRFVTARGWRQAAAAGVRTIVDLRNDDEVDPAASGATRAAGSATFQAPAGRMPLPDGITVVRVPIDDIGDTALWHHLNSQQLNGTPLYFRPFIDAKPDRCAAALAAIARARPGGVIFHCGAGRDRTGLVALLVLSLAEVTPEAIAGDYELSAGELGALFTALGQPDQAAAARAALARRKTTARAAILGTLNGLDVARRLAAAGLTAADIAAIRGRLLG